MGYAEQTFVPVERTKAEIETLLVKSGCDAIATLWDRRERRVAIQFRAHNRMVRFSLTLPSPDDPLYQYTPAKKRSAVAGSRREGARPSRARQVAATAPLHPCQA